MSWFRDTFGFSEAGSKGLIFDEVRSAFKLEGSGNDRLLVVKKDGRKFAIGAFETPSVLELRKKAKLLLSPKLIKELGEITFQNICGDSRTLHLDPKNEGAVFQVASQFNCLEMVSPGVKPKHGITRYEYDMTQGPVCAIACPAATLFRNYFAGAIPGKGQDNNQLDNAADIAKLVNNAKHKYWQMESGYLLPCRRDSIKELNKHFTQKVTIDGKAISLSEAISSRLRVGVHWNTETARQRLRSPHRVCQVFSSALPISYTRTPIKDFAHLGHAILNGTYDATLSVGAILAAQRKKRVTVYLTCIGGGAFGNPQGWIADAIQQALDRWSYAPIDVRLVHYKRVRSQVYHGIREPLKGQYREMSLITEENEEKYSLQDNKKMVSEKESMVKTNLKKFKSDNVVNGMNKVLPQESAIKSEFDIDDLLNELDVAENEHDLNLGDDVGNHGDIVEHKKVLKEEEKSN